MRRYLKANVGRTVVVQCHKLAFRGTLLSAREDALELSSAAILDEDNPRQGWVQADGVVFVAAPQVRFVQVV